MKGITEFLDAVLGPMPAQGDLWDSARDSSNAPNRDAVSKNGWEPRASEASLGQLQGPTN